MKRVEEVLVNMQPYEAEAIKTMAYRAANGSPNLLIELIDALVTYRLSAPRMDIASRHLASGGSPHPPRMAAVEHRLREALSNAPFNSDERRAMIQQVEQLNRRLGYARAKDAVQAGHYPQYEVLLATWDMLYGPFGKTTDETRERRSDEHSGSSPLSHETGRDGLHGRPGEHEGRGDQSPSGDVARRGSGESEQPVSDGGGSGDSREPPPQVPEASGPSD